MVFQYINMDVFNNAFAIEYSFNARLSGSFTILESNEYNLYSFNARLLDSEIVLWFNAKNHK